MRTILLASLTGVAVACSPAVPTAPEAIGVPVQITTSAQAAGVPHNFDTHLTGDAERPTPNDSRAQGQAVLQLSADGTALHYRLNVGNILNVTQAHIHLGQPNATGGIVAWLYPSAPPLQLIPGRTQGTLGQGTIRASNLVGALAGENLSALIAAIRAGGAYVNVHTLAFPPGEIRGQLR